MSKHNGNGNGQDVTKQYEEAFKRLAEVREQLRLLKLKAESLGHEDRVAGSCVVTSEHPLV